MTDLYNNKSCSENHNTHFIFNNLFFWILNSRNTHSEYVIIDFPMQHWSEERASMLRYTYFVLLYT